MDNLSKTYLLIFLNFLCFAFEGGQGLEVEHRVYKNVVKVLYEDKFICTGVVVDANTVLSSAHCFDKLANHSQLGKLTVQLYTGESLVVFNIEAHNSYKNMNVDRRYDVAKLTTEDISDFNKIEISSKKAQAGQRVLVVGFDNSREEIIYGETYINDVFGHELLIDEGPVVLCHGDSGAPVFIEEEDDTIYLSSIATKGEIGCSGQGVITSLSDIF